MGSCTCFASRVVKKSIVISQKELLATYQGGDAIKNASVSCSCQLESTPRHNRITHSFIQPMRIQRLLHGRCYSKCFTNVNSFSHMR